MLSAPKLFMVFVKRPQVIFIALNIDLLISRLTVMGGKEPSGSMCGDRSGEVGDCMYACGGGGTRSAHI